MGKRERNVYTNTQRVQIEFDPNEIAAIDNLRRLFGMNRSEFFRALLKKENLIQIKKGNIQAAL